jgi:hypothetical protein
MRNIIQYPITTEEIADCLNKILLEEKRKQATELACGDMTCWLLSEAIKIVKNTKDYES